MLKFINTDVVFQEIPDEVTLAINISNCPCRCPGCHSSYLWKDEGTPLTTVTLSELIKKYKDTITCLCFMGGDIDPQSVDLLAQEAKRMDSSLRIGWYSGRLRISPAVKMENFDYIKIGPYIQHLGPLNSPTTNQRLYKKQNDSEFVDITPRFWKNPG